jgi:hypothetical protein
MGTIASDSGALAGHNGMSRSSEPWVTGILRIWESRLRRKFPPFSKRQLKVVDGVLDLAAEAGR